jgi:hypothetical protein
MRGGEREERMEVLPIFPSIFNIYMYRALHLRGTPSITIGVGWTFLTAVLAVIIILDRSLHPPPLRMVF